MEKKTPEKPKRSKLSFDGLNLLMRIPLEIQKELGLKKGDYLIWKIHGRKIRLEIQDPKGVKGK